MKKALSILLVLLMVFSFAALAGCAKEEEAPAAGSETPAAGTETPAAGTETPAAGTETPAAGTETPAAPEGETEEEKMARLEGSKPNEYVMEKLEAGMEVMICWSPVTLGSEVMKAMDEVMKEKCEAAGFTYVCTPFNLDTALQLQTLENWLTMGATAIGTVAFDDGCADIATRCLDAGTDFIVLYNIPQFPYSLAMTSAPYDIGYCLGSLASHWVDERYADAADGSVLCALDTVELNASYIERFQGVRDALNANPKIKIEYEQQETMMTIDVGYAFAEAALTYNSNIRLFVTMTAGMSIGVNNYVLSQTGLKLDEYATFGGDDDAAARALIDIADGGGDSILRGLVSFGTANPADFYFDYMMQMYKGEIEKGTGVILPNYSYDCVGFDYVG